MEKPQLYVIHSLELHLFFARIMKEHALFLKVGFLPPNEHLAQEAEKFLRCFDALLSRTVSLSDHVVRSSVLRSGEVYTEFTEAAEGQTQKLTGTRIDRELTVREMNLQGSACAEKVCVTPVLAGQVQNLNRDALTLVGRLIAFKEQLLHCVDTCEIFTANYPLLIEHILREARLYRASILHLEGKGQNCDKELRDSELFWNRIMMEHALFIRGLLDPTEENLICVAADFAKDYRRLLSSAAKAQDCMLEQSNALTLTKSFRDFKQAGVEGITACKIRSIILPLLADHVLREANHYIRLLEM